MGYMHVENLYRDKRILMFKECFALEKIDGTSTNIHYKYADNTLEFFHGGCRRETFLQLFNLEELLEKFKSLNSEKDVIIYGEGYGGKIQGMSGTYGPDLKFIAFEVQIGESWLNVTNAHDVVTKLGLEFVDYVQIKAEIADIETEKLKPSVQAKRNGILEDKKREGIVLRPLLEYVDYRGNRIITKHKNDEFRETTTKRELSDADLKVLEDAQQIVDEWVTPTRLEHILQKFPGAGTEKIPDIIEAMYEDVTREGKGEIVESRQLRKLLNTKTAVMFKNRLKEKLLEN